MGSILWLPDRQPTWIEPPADTMTDLRIGEVLAALEAQTPATAAVWFRRPLQDAAQIRFRQQVMQDFADPALRAAAAAFAQTMQDLQRERQALCQEPNFTEQYLSCGAYLQLADRYCRAVRDFARTDRREIHAAGLQQFFAALDACCAGPAFTHLEQQVAVLRQQLAGLHFCLLIREGKIRVRPCEGEQPVQAELDRLLGPFQQDAPPVPPMEPPRLRSARHVDEAILDLLAHSRRAEFTALRSFAAERTPFPAPELMQFAEEVPFYLSWHRLIGPLQAQGLPFCCPEIRPTGEPLFCEDSFDLALALSLQETASRVVPNTFQWTPPEQILVITGPNQGGKTTFARSVGQAFYWASLGCCIPGRRAALRCFDGLYTHFNREEDIGRQSGRLREELVRLHGVLQQATRDSILIVNEIYSSTTLQDAVCLGKKMMADLIDRGCLTVCVTFLDELAGYDIHTVSMMSTVDPDDPRRRSFRVVRKPADGLAYASQLARNHGLDFETLDRRLTK